MSFQSKLPYTVPASLKIKPKDPGPLVKARTHEKRAEALRGQARDAERQAERIEEQPREHRGETAPEGPKPHLEYLERWRVLEHTITPIEARAKHEWKGKLAVDEMKAHQVIGHLIASLPRPRLDALFKDPRIAELNVLFGHRELRKIVVENELLQDLGVDWPTFLEAKRDLKFQLGIQSYKSAQALACYLTIVRAAADPKVRKKQNLVTDHEVLTVATGILRDVTTHIVEEMQAAHDSFFAVGSRQQEGDAFRIERATKSGRPVPPADAQKGKPNPKADIPKVLPRGIKA